MPRCKKYQKLIKRLLTDELSEQEQKELAKHVQQCSDCAMLMKIHNSYQSASFEVKPPGEERFKQMRSSVLNKISIKEKKARNRWIEFFFRFKSYTFRPAVALALVIGFLLGRAIPPESKDMIKQINTLANKNVNLIDIQNSPYSYSNISFKDLGDDNIALSFNVSTHLELVRPKDDPLVRDVLSQALMESRNVGGTLKAISYSETIIDQKIKEALLFSMHNAPILAVRLKALQSLVKYKNDRDVSAAFLKVVKEEESIQMRLLAMDYLIENKIEPEKLHAVVSKINNVKNTALVLKAKEYIKQ
jgi:hypothetical protein